MRRAFLLLAVLAALVPLAVAHEVRPAQLKISETSEGLFLVQWKVPAKGRQRLAIDPVFALTDPESYFWTGTTHLEGGRNVGSQAVYVAFGRALGFMRFPGQSEKKLIDVHGAGAQRSDPKSGDPARWAEGHGPQGDDVRILNWARAVRTAD